ncbi:MAG TPA: bifunctional tetrahydrofolate synthase/dihydrofolate synthase, partial [Burkholderiales bacterium]|nr:bifunctional tetrahydrofolate synthase/dihydrofolate synthase [Burkholderiales bacterium]
LARTRVDRPATLSGWLEFIEHRHPQAIALGLERVRDVLERLELPALPPAITVAGTNGKGSTCAMLEAILGAAGYRVGCYTSPHLLRYNERVRLLGEDALDAALAESFARVEAARGQTPLTYFEFGTLAAMDVFIRERVDLAVLEVGLGGRLDAVNAFDSDCAVVTSVDFDHMEYLGNNRDSIGAEKAGIFRAGRPAICGEVDAPAGLLRYAQEIGAKLHLIGRDYGFNADPNQWQFWSTLGKRSALPYPALRGDYQLGNAATALSALEQLKERLPVDMGAIRRGLLDVRLAGRFQVLPGRPMVILDVGHNPHAARALASSLRRLPGGGRTIAVFAMLRDKDIEGVAAAMREEVDEWLVAGLSSPRGAGAERIRQALAAAQVGVPVAEFDTPVRAYQHAIRSAGQNDKILVFGSFYTVGAVLAARE